MQPLHDAVAKLIGFLPALIAGLVVLAVGWGLAVLASLAARRLLPRMGFDRFLAQHGLTNRDPEKRAGSRAVAGAAAWLIFLAALMQASNIWGLGFISAGLANVFGYLPNVIAALLIMAGAVLIGNWAANRVRTIPGEDQKRSVVLPGAVRAGILTIGAFLALRQLLIATEILVIGFTIVFGAIALATALAFGLGGRRAAEEMTEDWYHRQRRIAPGPNGERVDAPGPRRP